MKKVFALICLIVFCVIKLQAQQFIPLWPKDSMPNSKGIKLGKIEDRQRVTQVSTPCIYCFFPSNDENKGSAVLICPAGGYQKLTYYSSGFQFAKWLNTLGVNAFVLFYRLPNSPDLIEREKGPVQDAQRAMKIIRANAKTWSINEQQIGIMGASAGGHLASTVATHIDDFSNINDSIDQHSYRPDFMILISPVINMGKYTHKGSLYNFLGDKPSPEKIQLYSNEKQVNSNTPPSFIVHAQDDHGVSPFNSIMFYEALINNNIQGSIHIFPYGDHSIGLRGNPGSTNLWTTLCEEWLKEMKFIKEE